jgi:hypothetical protein
MAMTTKIQQQQQQQGSNSRMNHGRRRHNPYPHPSPPPSPFAWGIRRRQCTMFVSPLLASVFVRLLLVFWYGTWALLTTKTALMYPINYTWNDNDNDNGNTTTGKKNNTIHDPMHHFEKSYNESLYHHYQCPHVIPPPPLVRLSMNNNGNKSNDTHNNNNYDNTARDLSRHASVVPYIQSVLDYNICFLLVLVLFFYYYYYYYYDSQTQERPEQ